MTLTLTLILSHRMGEGRFGYFCFFADASLALVSA